MELLIVIVVIGVLSAMMMLSSTEAVSSARASNIVSNLRNLKTATLAWYADNLDNITPEGRVKINGTIQQVQQWRDSDLGISKYLNGEELKLNTKDTPDERTYCINSLKGAGKVGNEGDRRTWYVGYRFADKGDDAIKEKIKGKKASIGLHFTDQYPAPNSTELEVGKYVWLKIMGDEGR